MTIPTRIRREQAACKMASMPFHGQGMPGSLRKGRPAPPEETSEEAAYLKALGEKQKPVSIKMADGEVVRGWIEYYDKNMVRLTREGQPNLFILKPEIMYIAEDAPPTKQVLIASFRIPLRACGLR